ncbi:hypothetical protein MASR1M107_34380 [Ignavibacteriales bacterium]
MTTRRDFLRALGIITAVTATGAGSISILGCSKGNGQIPGAVDEKPALPPNPWVDGDTEVLMSTFLGNECRRFYGKGDVNKLKIKSKFRLGCSESVVGSRRKSFCGAGWTGAPTVYMEAGKLMLVLGGYDQYLRKFEADGLKEVWKYKNNDIMKGAGSVYIDTTAAEPNRIVLLQGSRLGNGNSVQGSKVIPSFRAISYRTGKEIWKFNVPKSVCYSRDNDSSPLYLGDGMLFNAVESGFGFFLSSKISDAAMLDGINQPKVLGKVKLFEDSDAAKHGNNIVVEASPARMGDRLFIASGAGHIYGIDIKKMAIDYDYYTGSDIDGSTVVTKDNKIIATIEKQYIPGKGGVLKLDPSKPAEDSVEWFFPTKNTTVAEWQGGIIGTAAINDEYNPNNEYPAIWITLAIDGNLYVGSQHELSGDTTLDTLNKKKCAVPKLLAKIYVGPSIGSPIITSGNKIVAPTYNGLHLVQMEFVKGKKGDGETAKNAAGVEYGVKLKKLETFHSDTSFEATPVVWNDTVYCSSRDGYLYALG